MDDATRQAFTTLEAMLRGHEEMSAVRGNEICSMLAMLPEPAETWTGTVRIPWFGLVRITLRPEQPAARGGR